MAFVDAYDSETGEKLPYSVPERHIDHPVLGVRLSRLPSAKARKDAAKTASGTTTTPAVGDEKKETPHA